VTKKAIVTLALGREYSDRFETYCRKNWTAYAERHGLDLFVFKDPLDRSERASKRSPAWQKCLILGEPELTSYERVVWVDADISINPASPSILEGVPLERVGAIDEHSFPTPQSRQALLREIIAASPQTGGFDKRYWRAWLDPSAWHASMGLPPGQSHIVQTGVMVLSPKHHRELLEHVYRTYDDGGSKLFNYEMRPLSYEIQTRALQHWIDARFNALIWWIFLHRNIGAERAPTPSEIHALVRDAYRNSYFLHFAGAANLMPLLASTTL
jgi:hypothetical protein